MAVLWGTCPVVERHNTNSSNLASQAVRSITSPLDEFKAGSKLINNYRYGRRKEHKVAHQLRRHGARVKMSSGSRGAADLKAKFRSGKSWHVQVKSSRSGTPASPSGRCLGRLKIGAGRSKATPVVAKVSRAGISYLSARSGRRLSPR
jgi:hypothetical protein